MNSYFAIKGNLPSDKGRGLKSIRSRNTLFVILFLLPALLLFLSFVIYPIFRSAYFSTFKWTGLGQATTNIGLANYKKILTDTVFFGAVKNILIIIVLSLVIQLPVALGLAVMVGKDLPGRSVFRTIFFLPYVLSEVNAAIMWTLLYNASPDRGLLNSIVVNLFHLPPVGWLSDPKVIMVSIFITLTWKYFGFYMLLFLTGLQNIPTEIEEAALMDGANSFQNFFYITLPLLGSTIRTSVQMSVLGSIQQFIIVWVMTGGGPVNASETLAIYMYKFAFVRHQFGYGSAIAIIMFILCVIFSLIYQALTRKPDYLTGL
jgi:raffinose/stachyose/melibiose transport system permease protein